MKYINIKNAVAAFLVASSMVGCSAEKSPENHTRQQFDYDKGRQEADSRAVGDIDTLLQSFIDEEKASSVVGFVARDGKVLYSNAFGWKDRENSVPASVDDYYVLFSQTKAITTVAFMTLVEQGLVDINDPVSKYFPGIPDRVITAINEDGSYETRPASTPMTFVHLMSHTSGLNAGLAGRPLQEYVRESVLEPLGMENTDWYYEPEALDRFVKAYSLVDGQLVSGSNVYSKGAVSEQQTYTEGAIGLNGPIEDYARFCQMLLNKGEFNGHRILQPQTVEQMTTINRLPIPEEDDNGFRFGLGFELFSDKKKPVPEVSGSAYAWGGMMGTEYIIDPENNMIALFYLNMYQRDALYPEFLKQAYQAAQPTR